MAFELAAQIAAGNSQLNLQGILVGDGAIDPLTQFTGFADLTFYMGFANLNERETIRGYEERITALIGQQQWKAAFVVFDELLNGDFFPFPTYFRNITGLSDYFNELSVSVKCLCLQLIPHFSLSAHICAQPVSGVDSVARLSAARGRRSSVLGLQRHRRAQPHQRLDAGRHSES